MKRLLVLLGLAVGTLLVTASTALAQYPPTSVPGPEVDPSPAALPFTGVNLIWPIAIILSLLVVGVILRFAGRRHSRV